MTEWTTRGNRRLFTTRTTGRACGRGCSSVWEAATTPFVGSPRMLDRHKVRLPYYLNHPHFSKETMHMPEFMDVHRGMVGITADGLLEAHNADLAIQDE